MTTDEYIDLFIGRNVWEQWLIDNWLNDMESTHHLIQKLERTF